MRAFIRLAIIILFAALPAFGQTAAIPITGQAQPTLAAFDKMMVQFLQEHHATGASLAITYRGALVYARGFGWADREAHLPVRPQSLFRVASVSKPITAVAVARLAQEGALSFSDHPFLELGIPPLLQLGVKQDARLGEITILELLQHRAGFDRAMTPDPMFKPILIARACGDAPPASAVDIIRYMEGRPLDFAPGARYAYSNFGYCVLGRVVEKASGQRYGDYVRDKILLPLGIADMRLGRTLTAAPGEVKYYTAANTMVECVYPPLGRMVAAPYGGFSLESHDSCGGWIATAADLVRFQSAFDEPAKCPLLNAASVNELFAQPVGPTGPEKLARDPATPAWVGCGWSVNALGPAGRINYWKIGAFVGTSAMMEHQSDGIDWAVEFNQEADGYGVELSTLMGRLMRQTETSVTVWPAGVGRETAWP